MTIPQILVTLSPQGNLIAELPGTQATRRQVPLRTSEAGETLLRILQAQANTQVELGLDGAPTVKQVQHWERHGTFPSQSCRFCIAEGRINPNVRVRRAVTVVVNGDVEVRRVKAGLSAKHKTLQTKKTTKDLGL